MIDLHCHLLPGLDDGVRDLSEALVLARQQVADGVQVVACTPHVFPGLYHNSGPQIRHATEDLQAALEAEGIPLTLVVGADVHVTPHLIAGLKSGDIPSLNGTRYVLVEPPHHVAPPRLEEFFFSLVAAGYVPILTHPERLTWIEERYEAFGKLVRAGVWMQLTAGSLTGQFGQRAKHWAIKLLQDGHAHILATDAHDPVKRPANLSRGWDLATQIVGNEEAEHLVLTRPLGILTDELPTNLPMPRGADQSLRVRNEDQRDAGKMADVGSKSLRDGVRGWLSRRMRSVAQQ